MRWAAPCRSRARPATGSTFTVELPLHADKTRHPTAGTALAAGCDLCAVVTADLIIAAATGELTTSTSRPSVCCRSSASPSEVARVAGLRPARPPRGARATRRRRRVRVAGVVRQADRLVGAAPPGSARCSRPAGAAAHRSAPGPRSSTAPSGGALDAVDVQRLAATHVDVQQPRRPADDHLRARRPPASSRRAPRRPAACRRPATPQPLAINTAAAAEMTAPAKKIRLIENMLAPPVSLSWFVVPFTTDHMSKGWAKPWHVYILFSLIYFGSVARAGSPTTRTTCSNRPTDCPIRRGRSGGGEQGAHHLGELALHHRRRRRQILREGARRRIAGARIHAPARGAGSQAPATAACAMRAR